MRLPWSVCVGVALIEHSLTIRTVAVPIRMGLSLAAEAFGLERAIHIAMSGFVAVLAFVKTSLRSSPFRRRFCHVFLCSSGCRLVTGLIDHGHK